VAKSRFDFLMLGALAFVGTLYFATHFPTRGLPYSTALTSRTRYCDIFASLDGVKESNRQLALHSDIATRSRALATDGPFRLWQTPEGQIWMPADSDNLVSHLLAEQARHAYGAPVCRTGDVVIDCGAHVGVFTRQALQDGARIVVSVEPAPENLECLRRNLASQIAAGRVIVVPKAVWDRPDTLRIQHFPGNSGADHISTDPGGTEVPMVTLDSLVADLKLDDVDLIKMDIEGAERRALMGAAGLIKRFRPRLSIASYHKPQDPEALQQIAIQLNPNYRTNKGVCILSEHDRRIIPELLFFE
jgi:FkbM family methyltransferase